MAISVRIDADNEAEARAWAMAHGIDTTGARWYASRDGKGGRLYIDDALRKRPNYKLAQLMAKMAAGDLPIAD